MMNKDVCYSRLKQRSCYECERHVDVMIDTCRRASESELSISFLPFYHAMLCIAIAGMRCPSVCPSVTFVSCAKTTKDIFEIYSPSGSLAIPVVPYQTGWRYSDGNPLTGASNARGYEK